MRPSLSELLFYGEQVVLFRQIGRNFSCISENFQILLRSLCQFCYLEQISNYDSPSNESHHQLDHQLCFPNFKLSHRILTCLCPRILPCLCPRIIPPLCPRLHERTFRSPDLILLQSRFLTGNNFHPQTRLTPLKRSLQKNCPCLTQSMNHKIFLNPPSLSH